MIRIILADDHNIVRNGIKNLLGNENNIKVVGEALGGEQVLELINTTTADLVLADMNMPGIGGIELAEMLPAADNSVKVILLTMHDQQPYVNKAFGAGVYGYLLKNISAEELMLAIRLVYSGQKYICNELALRLLDQLLKADIANAPMEGVELTDREIDVLKLVADGLTNREIAEQLFSSKRTVEGHRQAMINKTGVANTAALIKYALNRGIL